MDQAIYNAAAAMRASERRLELIAHNLSNVNTTAFKRKNAAVEQFVVQHPDRQERVQALVSFVDFTQGDLRRTGLPFDLAFMGPGFITVETPEGEAHLRSGSFMLDGDGVLQTYEGYPLAWEERFGPIDPNGVDPEIDATGNVYQGVTQIGRLRLVDFADYNYLQELPHGLWAAGPGSEEIAVAGEMHQGSLEASNSTGMNELIDMIVNQRAYELSATAIQMLDQSYRRLNRQG
jgi:flagellar basal body rod protein FlgG